MKTNNNDFVLLIFLRKPFRTTIMRATMKKLLLGLGLAAVCLTAHADNCDHTRNSLDAIHCSNIIYQKADKELNTVYKQLTKKLSVANKKTLRSGQLRWIKQRDQACTMNSVDMGEVIDSACLLDQTTSRTNWLNDRLRECTTVGCMASKLDD